MENILKEIKTLMDSYIKIRKKLEHEYREEPDNSDRAYLSAWIELTTKITRELSQLYSKINDWHGEQ